LAGRVLCRLAVTESTVTVAVDGIDITVVERCERLPVVPGAFD